MTGFASKWIGKPAHEDAIAAIAKNVLATRFDGLPPAAVEATKWGILDTLGITVAGSTAVGCGEVVAQLEEWGGKPESTILAYGICVPSPAAAMANSMMAHAHDFDDTHDVAVVHSFAPVLAAAMATAEALGRPVSGRELITAVALGVDFHCRLGLAAKQSMADTGWQFTAISGGFAAAAACGKLIGLDESSLIHAFGIAYSQASGNGQAVDDGAMSKRLQTGFCSKAGVVAALFARRGLTGAKSVLEGRAGFYRVYEHGIYDRDELLRELGVRFEGVNTGLKPYPCCRYTHPAIDAAVVLAQRHAIDVADIESVTARVSSPCLTLVGKPYKAAGNSQVDGQFSIPYTVATALIRREVWIDDFGADMVNAPVRTALAAKVRVVREAKFDVGKGLSPLELEVCMRSGAILRHRVEEIKGSPENPMDERERSRKFVKCMEHSVRPIAKDGAQRVLEMVAGLEKVESVAEITKLLLGRRR